MPLFSTSRTIDNSREVHVVTKAVAVEWIRTVAIEWAAPEGRRRRRNQRSVFKFRAAVLIIMGWRGYTWSMRRPVVESSGLVLTTWGPLTCVSTAPHRNVRFRSHLKSSRRGDDLTRVLGLRSTPSWPLSHSGGFWKDGWLLESRSGSIYNEPSGRARPSASIDT